eukprot:657910-Amphidinium_carterae.1
MSADANLHLLASPTEINVRKTEMSRFAVEVSPYGFRKFPHITTLDFLFTKRVPSSAIAGLTTYTMRAGAF